MTAYYNEIDPYAAQWLRNLIAAGHIAPGDVDERSIVDVRPDELTRYTQCHFFAGIGGWSLALRLADWPDDRSVWTGSCPCQPFSAAGKGEAADDERHLWPAWLPLIAERRPPVVFGEQVEAAVGWGWVDAVFSDLEAEGYACGTAVLPACGVGAPHIRQRLWFVGTANRTGCQARDIEPIGNEPRPEQPTQSSLFGVADADGGDASPEGLQRGGKHGQQQEDGRVLRVADTNIKHGRRQHEFGVSSGTRPRQQSTGRGSMGDTTGPRCHPSERPRQRNGRSAPQAAQPSEPSHWGNLEWLPCTDGKARPVEPGTFPLAHGIPGRVGRLRAYGNAIIPQVAAEFIRACAN